MNLSSKISLVLDVQVLLGLINNTSITQNGLKLVKDNYQKLFEYFEKNIDPADVGFYTDNNINVDPIQKFWTITIPFGIRFFF